MCTWLGGGYRQRYVYIPNSVVCAYEVGGMAACVDDVQSLTVARRDLVGERMYGRRRRGGKE